MLEGSRPRATCCLLPQVNQGSLFHLNIRETKVTYEGNHSQNRREGRWEGARKEEEEVVEAAAEEEEEEQRRRKGKKREDRSAASFIPSPGSSPA